MQSSTLLWVLVHVALQIAAILRILTREDRDPPIRLSWIIVVLALPVLGVLSYLMFGEARIATRPRRRMRKALADLAALPVPEAMQRAATGYVSPAFARAAAANSFHPVAGNSIEMMQGSDGFIDTLIADIERATREIQICFYIWLTDRNGTRVADALTRAAARGVSVRCLVDGLGSRSFLASDLWRDMRAAGVQTAIAFPFRFSLLRALRSRIDIRNHRKIIVIDGAVGYCGSQNCADPEFLVKAAFGPWVDVMVRVTGPVVWQLQVLFVTDWITHSRERSSALLPRLADAPEASGRATAIALGSGPELQKNAVTDVFQAVMAAAREELVITTPYFVPDHPLQNEICAAAIRGVKVRMLVPLRNDSRIVAHASRSFYAGLIRAGVQLLEYEKGFLHAKILIADRNQVLIGSANMDRRSLDLNYENCLLVSDAALAGALLGQVDAWSADCRAVTLAGLRKQGMGTHIVNNLAALFAPLV